MQPTRKALALTRPLQELLVAARGLTVAPDVFDPALSNRNFHICISDAGIVGLLPQAMRVLQGAAPRITLETVQIESGELRNRLEAGDIDLAVGPFPVLPQTIRRRRLWREGYISLARRDHPRLSPSPGLAAFCAERHILVTPAGAHPHRGVTSALLTTLPHEQIALREPSFVAAAMIVKYTDFVTTLPAHIGRMLAQELGLQVLQPPVTLPRVPIGLYWHERSHRDEGNRWLRSMFFQLFGKGAASADQRDV